VAEANIEEDAETSIQTMLSQRKNRLFLVASVMTFVGLGIGITATIIDLTLGFPSVSFGDSIASMVGFLLIFVLAASCVVAQFILWFGMIWLTLVDSQPLLFKVPLVLFQILFMSIGSAIVYLTFYRPRTNYVARLKVNDI
jgi:hypothetical protein